MENKSGKTVPAIELSMAGRWRSSQLSAGNAAYIEDLYEEYLRAPDAVGAEWKQYFDQLPRVGGVLVADVPHSDIVHYFEMLGKQSPQKELHSPSVLSSTSS